MLKKVLALTLLLALLAGCAAPVTAPAASDAAAPAASDAAAPAADAIELVLGSWRVDDVAQMETILAAFTAENPGNTVKFDPTNPPDYNTTLRAQLEGGTGPDLMYLRSYANSRILFADGFVEPLDAMKDELVAAYGEANLVPWATLEGQSYGVPIIAVSHGIYYNKQIFSDLGLEIPTTWEQLIADAQTIKDAGFIPFANASGDPWTIAEIVFMNLAPNFIGGRDGRLAASMTRMPSPPSRLWPMSHLSCPMDRRRWSTTTARRSSRRARPPCGWAARGIFPCTKRKSPTLRTPASVSTPPRPTRKLQ